MFPKTHLHPEQPTQERRWQALRAGFCRQCKLSAFCLSSAVGPLLRLTKHHFAGRVLCLKDAREKAQAQLPCYDERWEP